MNPIKDLANYFIEVFNVTSSTGIATSVVASGIVFGVGVVILSSLFTLSLFLIKGKTE